MNKKPGYRVFSALRSAFPVVLLGALLIGQTGSVRAQAIAESPCDTKYYDSLKSRAWLEAQREITQNQNLIFKPDSVLQYTCFDHFLGVLSDKAPQMFSDSPVPSPGTPLGTLLGQIVGTAVNSYLNANFSHPNPGGPMLGGRSTITYTPTYPPAYNCTMMNRVWKEAKCMNFAEKENDGFFTFVQHAGDEKRYFPTKCAGTGQWLPEIKNATGPDTPWPRDNVKTFFAEMFNCGIAAPIATGILKTNSTGGQETEEKFCVPPGCFYNMASGQCS